MAPTGSELDFVETKKRTDSWVKGFATNLSTMKAESLGYHCNVGKHSLTYDIVSASTTKPVVHIAFADIIDQSGKSKLLHEEGYDVVITIKDQFWDEPIRELSGMRFKELLRQLFKNPKIGIVCRLIKE